MIAVAFSREVQDHYPLHKVVLNLGKRALQLHYDARFMQSKKIHMVSALLLRKGSMHKVKDLVNLVEQADMVF